MMYDSYNYNKDFQLKSYISSAINTKSKSSKKHSDSLNCLINCAQFKVTLHISPKPGNGKNGIFYVQKGDKFHPLFFCDIPSNKVIDEIQSKNESKKLLNTNQRIETENEIFVKYDQNKKSKMLLFNYIKFPLQNINKENNEKKLSTIIIIDNEENDMLSNFSITSSILNQQTCSFSLVIKNINNCNYLFSLSDIKDCKEIKIKLDGTVHEQTLFDKEIIIYISPELIENSIRKRMEKYMNDDNIEDLIGKYFFTKLNDTDSNNIGILFSIKEKSKTSKLKYDKEYLKTDRYLINKIFLLIDMWISPSNINNNTFSSTKSTSQTILINNNKSEEKNINKKNKYGYENIPNEFMYYYPNYYNMNNINESKFSYYNNNYSQTKDSNLNNFYNNMNNIYSDNDKYLYNYNYQVLNPNDINNKYINNYNSFNDIYFKSDYDNYMNYYNKESELNNLFNLIEKMEKMNEYREPEILIDPIQFKTDTLYFEEKLNKIYSETESSSKLIAIVENKSEENSFIKRTLFIDMNEELMRKLFEKFEQDKCISNYTIVKKMLDINMNIDPKEENWQQNTKLNDFFDLFQNANQPFLNIPFITKKGNLFVNCLSPSLSSMLLVLKAKRKVIRDIKNNCKKFRGFSADVNEKNKKILKLEFEEIKPAHKRELLYKKIIKIKKILGEARLKTRNVLIKNSYFSILWTITNNINTKSSFLAYYSFDFKLIGILILNLNYNHWMTPFSYKLENYHDYKTEYEKNVENVKKMFENLPIDKDDDHCDNYFKYDYFRFLKGNKPKEC